MIDSSEYVKPKCSVYGILYLHEWPKSMVNVGKYYIHGASGHGVAEGCSKLRFAVLEPFKSDELGEPLNEAE